jgi:long-chain acyl-CoA synthetase
MATLYRTICRYNDSQYHAIYFENKSFTFQKTLKNIRKMVRFLKEKGVKKGDVVTVALPNIPASIYLFYALDALGAVQNIVHPLTTAPRILETMQETNSHHAVVLETMWKENKALFSQSEDTFFFANPMYDKSFFMRHAFYLQYQKVKQNNHLFSLEGFRACKEETEIVDRDDSENSIYLHSGGTTGTPKVIALSDDSINQLALKADGIIGKDTEGKSMLAVLPAFHGFGLGMGIHAPLVNGAASTLMIKFDAKKVIRFINQGKIRYIIGVPLLYQKLMKTEGFEQARLDYLECCFVGGDKVHVSGITAFQETMQKNGSSCMLLEGYGLTETVTVCCVNTKEQFKLGSVGRPLRGITIEIRDDQMQRVPANTVGEVYVKGDTLMNEYLNDQAATEKTLVQLDGEMWVRTGDLGYLDEDGFLFLKERIKRMFKVSGMNVYPSEVEKIVTDSEDIVDASLEFFESPKPHTVLFVIQNRNSQKSQDALREEIMQTLSARVLKYSLPQKIVFMDQFPQTKVGKIDHKAFQNQ